MQLRHRPLPNYLESVQRTITGDMRAVLIDWLVEVAEEYRLVTETLYLTVAYLDRFLSVRRIDPPQLQLLGVTCMCIAAKFEELYPPPVKKFSEITDNGCTVQDIVDAEGQMLSVLNFHLSTPTAKVRAHASSVRCVRACACVTWNHHCLPCALASASCIGNVFGHYVLLSDALTRLSVASCVERPEACYVQYQAGVRARRPPE